MPEGLSVFDLLDGGDSGFKSLQEALLDLRLRVRKTMDQGLNPMQFACAEKVRTAVENGIETTDKLYEKIRG